MKSIVSVIFILTAVCSTCWSADEGVVLESIVKLLHAREIAIPPLEISYQYKYIPLEDFGAFQRDTAKMQELQGNSTKDLILDPETYRATFDCLYRFNGNNKYYFQTVNENTKHEKIYASKGLVHIRYQSWNKHADIANEFRSDIPLYVDYVIGMPNDYSNYRPPTHRPPLVSEALKTADSLLDVTKKADKGRFLTLRAIFSRPKQPDYKTGTNITFDLGKGAAISRLEIFTLRTERGKTETLQPYWILESSDFVQINPVIWLPKNVKITKLRELSADNYGKLPPENQAFRGKLYRYEMHEFRVTGIKDASSLPKEDFSVKLPPGVWIHDELTGQN